MKFLSLFILLSFYSFSQDSKKKIVIKDGYDLITASYNTYEGGKWYRNFTFSQETKFYKGGKPDKTEIWYEAISAPSKLLIKFNSKDSKDGLLFEGHKAHTFKEGSEIGQKPLINDLCLAAFDIYFLKPAETSHLLDSLGYNLKIVREDIFDGRKVYVTGALKNDTLSNQLWIDAERFYLHRIIYKKGRDVIFTDYKQLEDNWVATKVVFKQNGLITTEEKYFDVKFPNELSKDLFDPAKFNEVKLD